MSAAEQLATALVDALDGQALEELARRLEPFLPAPVVDDGWLDTKAAAKYLAASVSEVHRLVAERAVRFSQEGPGARCYFRRAWLDAVRDEHVREPR